MKQNILRVDPKGHFGIIGYGHLKMSVMKRRKLISH